MSAPTPAPGDDRPREGYYPDPSIPGYVRYWNGAAWVPGTSRPAPAAGERLAPPPGAGTSVEETGPHFFDEDPVAQAAPAGEEHGGRPAPGTAWGAGGQPAWPAAKGSDPRVPHDPPGEADPGTFVFRRPVTGERSAPDAAAGAGGPADEGTLTIRAVPPHASHPATPGGQGPRGATAPAASGGPAAPAASAGPAGSAASAGSAGLAGPAAAAASAGPAASAGSAAPAGLAGPLASAGSAAPTAPAAPTGPAAPTAPGPDLGAGRAAAGAAAVQPEAVPAPSGPQRAPGSAPARTAPPPQAATPQPLPSPPAVPHPAPAAQAPAAPALAAPLTTGPGGGQSSWAQQVHRLAGAAGDERPVAPWKPPVEDVFQAAARRQASARPAGLGKRLVAKLLDTLVLGAVTAAAAVPLGAKAADHVHAKIDAAKLSGETVTVWLLDGTTGTYLGIVLAVLLLTGVVYDALPTAKWGRTLGKKLLGLEVRDIEAHETPSFGAALRRWLVYSVPGLLAVGIVGVAWCLFDRPWHQCWHDKAAHTFVAG
ncbi:RDD family protein [Streptomyces fumanus]|uniref:RDD family protein n=1 Tax=Streptomyces fumanus TaxID=67302 RepID=UPI0033F6429C